MDEVHVGLAFIVAVALSACFAIAVNVGTQYNCRVTTMESGYSAAQVAEVCK